MCKACDTDWKFIKTLRRIIREHGPVAVEDRISEYMRKADIARSVLRSASRG